MQIRRTTAAPIITVSLLPFLLLGHLHAQDTVSYEANATGAWGPNLTLEEEVRIGMTYGPEAFLFGDIADVAVGEDGKMWVADRMASEIRIFNPDGSHSLTVGGDGDGPGEFRNHLAALAFLPDGRLAAYDDGKRAVSLFRPNGSFISRTNVPKKFLGAAGDLFSVDNHGRYYILERDRSLADMPFVLLRLDQSGVILDTIRIPPGNREGPQHGGKRYDLGPMRPYAVLTISHLSPIGSLVVGRNDQYRLSLPQPDGRVIEVEKVWEPVPMKRRERAEAQTLVDHFSERWGEKGKRVPDQKPPYWQFWIDQGGRVWVALHGEGIRIPETESKRAERERFGNPPSEWKEDLTLDVFEPTGRFLGTIRPRNRRSRPVASDGKRLWMVETDPLGVQQVVRYRIVGG